VSLTRPEHPGRVAVVALVALVAVNVLFWGGRSQVDGPAATQRPVEIQALSPNEGELLLPQGSVGADLRDEFTGQISIDDRVIPKDQYTGAEELGEIVFQPGDGKEFEEFEKGSHYARIEWWPKTIISPEDARERQQLRSYSWAFTVG
jgi:hypothetical protein